MKLMSFSFALLALVTGLIAAYYWYKASKVEIVPLWQKLHIMEPIGGGDSHWIVGILEAVGESCSLNKIAAVWTASSVFLSAVSAVIGSWPFSN
jgi:hypothetical protein